MNNVTNIADLYSTDYAQIQTWVQLNKSLNSIVLDRQQAIDFINSIIDDDDLSTKYNCNLGTKVQRIMAFAEVLGDYDGGDEELDPEDLRPDEITRLLSVMSNEGIDVDGVRVCTHTNV